MSLQASTLRTEARRLEELTELPLTSFIEKRAAILYTY